MRPVYLEMNAFGPYAGKQIIDFRDLQGRNLFLICGPTGSGKTTVLDAICYALYGDTSGNERSGSNMRSKFAKDDDMTYVRFDFMIGEKQYRAVRYPQQERPKKRGEGTLTDPGSAALYDITDAGAEPRPMATKNVEAAVNELLGFKSEQFRQVVLLPQGDFRKLLLANSTERQGIMQVLFRTQRYGRFQELLRERYDKIEADNKEISEHIAHILESIQIEDEAGLEKRRLELEEQQGQVEKKKDQAFIDRDAYQKTVSAAQVLASQWKTLQDDRKAMKELQQQATAMTDKAHYIDRLKRAQLLAEPCNNLDYIQLQGTQAGSELDKATAAAVAAAAAMKQAQLDQKAVEEQENGYKADTEQAVQLQGLVEKVRNYAVIERDYTTQQKESNTLEAALKQVVADKMHVQQQLEAGVGLQSQLQKQLVELETMKATVAALKDRVVREHSIAALVKALAASHAALETAKTSLASLTTQAQQDKVDYEAVQAAFLQGQAAFLSRELKNGSPCPVCGATVHPKLAAIPDNLPQKTDVDRRKNIADTSEQQRQQQQVAMEKIAATAMEQGRQLADLRSQYPEEGTLADWQQRSDEAIRKADALQQNIRTMQEQVTVIKQLENGQQELERRETMLRNQADQARAAFAAAAAVMKQAENEVPVLYRQEATLQQAIQTVTSRIGKFEQQRKTVQETLRKTAAENAKCQENVRSLTERVEGLRKQYSEATEALKGRVLEAGFQTVLECRHIQKEVPLLPQQERELAAYTENVQQIAGRIKAAEQAIGNQPEPDMEQYQKDLAERNRICDELTKELTELKNLRAAIVRSSKEIDSCHAKQGHLADQYKTVGAMYELVSGKLNGGVNFERYVLGALLEDVLNAANERLNEMSRQRYQLQRSHGWQDKRKTVGLDIDVFDSYTGYARPANTLSGGETFLASLSLALGLADVVQAYAGGIHLDTIFIDEGFGSLDSDALDFALKALLDLEKDGRLVGIISHVPELRERIDTRLVITKTDRGSTAAFELV